MLSTYNKYGNTTRNKLQTPMSSIQNIVRDLKSSYVNTKTHLESINAQKTSKNSQLQNLVRHSSEEGHSIGSFRCVFCFEFKNISTCSL